MMKTECPLAQASEYEGNVGPTGRNAIAFILGLHGMRSAEICRPCRGRALTTRHVRRSWRRLAQRWLGRFERFHATRHTAAQRLFEATENLLKVQAFLGHKTMKATLIYAEETLRPLRSLRIGL